jgi:hypothetical protein
MLGRPSRRKRRKLEEHGTRATATVLEIAKKGMAITQGAEGVIGNTTLALRAKLRVEPKGAPAFEVAQRFRFSQLAVPSVGDRVAVIYDPDDHDNLMFDDSPEAAMSGAQSAVRPDLSAMLEKVREAQAHSGGDRMKLAEELRQEFGGNATVMMGPGAVAADPLDRLEKLHKLHEEGVLTDAEFQAQKAKLLGETA